MTKDRIFAVLIIVVLAVVSFASIATNVSKMESERVKQYKMFMR